MQWVILHSNEIGNRRLAPSSSSSNSNSNNAIHETSMHDSQYGKAEGISIERSA